MSKKSIAGFMMGISFGVIVGYFLKPPDDRVHESGKDRKQPAKPVTHNWRPTSAIARAG